MPADQTGLEPRQAAFFRLLVKEASVEAGPLSDEQLTELVKRIVDMVDHPGDFQLALVFAP